MIKIYWDGTTGIEVYSVSCPHCYISIEFFLASPIYCPYCREEIPPYYVLVERNQPAPTVNTKLLYYQLGKKWIDGDY